MCLDDAGCRSADVGRPGVFQEGDCFLSHDDRSSIPFQFFTSHAILDYYEKKRFTEPPRCLTVEEGVTALLTCPSGEQIVEVLFASFGLPQDGVACGEDATNSTCHEPSTYATLTSDCLGQTTCELSVSRQLLGNPCSGLLKLRVDYKCQGI